MKYFSIKKLEQFSGIKAHTIRIWEKRYGIFQPARKGNIRNYSLDDVKLILNISLLINSGFRISRLIDVPAVDIENKANSLSSELSIQARIIHNLIISMYSGDIEHFEQILDDCIQKIDVDHTIERIIIPFLEKIQLLSYNDTSIDAHFAVTALRKKLIYGIEKVKPAKDLKERVLLFLPEGEHYDLLLLYHTYKLKQKGYKTLYLGTNIDSDNFEIVLQQKKPDHICTYIAANYDADLRKYVRVLESHLPGTTLHIAEEKASTNTIKTKISLVYSSHKEIELANSSK